MGDAGKTLVSKVGLAAPTAHTRRLGLFLSSFAVDHSNPGRVALAIRRGLERLDKWLLEEPPSREDSLNLHIFNLSKGNQDPINVAMLNEVTKDGVQEGVTMGVWNKARGTQDALSFALLCNEATFVETQDGLQDNTPEISSGTCKTSTMQKGGYQIGLFVAGCTNMADWRQKGVFLAGIGNHAKEIIGLNIGAMVNASVSVKGVVLGAILAMGGTVKGLMVGMLCTAKRLEKGVLIGVITVVEDSCSSHGVQIGLFNERKDRKGIWNTLPFIAISFPKPDPTSSSPTDDTGNLK